MPLMWGSREIARHMPHFRGEPRALHPGFGAGRSASLIEHAGEPVAFDAPWIVHEDEDERMLKAYVRKIGAWNPLCPKGQYF